MDSVRQKECGACRSSLRAESADQLAPAARFGTQAWAICRDSRKYSVSLATVSRVRTGLQTRYPSQLLCHLEASKLE